nr:hypothetical protein [Tanacetum cinerariifolium]
MRTRSSSNLPSETSPNPSSSNPKRRNRRCSKKPFILEESLVDTMADQRTMTELLHAPTEGYAEAIVVPLILAEQFELKHSLINMMTSDQFFELEKDNPHDHIHWFNKITSTIKYKDVPNSAIKLMLFPFSLAGAACRWLEKEPPCSILTWEDLISKFINEYLSPSRTIDLHNEISNFQQRFDESFHEAWDRYKDLLPKLTHAVNQQTSAVTTTMMAILKQFQATPHLASDGNTFSELRDNIQGYGELKAITPRSGIILDGAFVPILPPIISPEDDEREEETLTDQDLAEYPIKIPPLLVQKSEPPSQRNFVVHQKDPLHLSIPYPSTMHKQKQQEKDEVQIHKFWQMFKQLHINIILADALILILKYHKMLKALLSNKQKLLELANIPLDENCSAVILKKLPEKLRDPGKFLIPCGFSELKCKALADLGASINLMPLSSWKKLGLPELISTRMTLELANRAICTPTGIASDVFMPTFLTDAHALIDVHREEMILRDGDERLTLNMRDGTLSYSNQPQKESINIINIYDDSCEDFLEDLFATNHQSGSLTFSFHSDLTSPEVKDDIFDPEGDMFLIEKLINLDSTKDLPPPQNINPLSDSTTFSSPNHLLEEFADEVALITFPPGNDDFSFDTESDLKEIQYFLNHDPIKEIDSILEDSIDESKLIDLNDNLVDTMPEMFTDEHALEYPSLPLYDEYDDDIFKVESSDFLPYPEYDSFLFEDFFEVDALPSTNNKDKVFNLGILIQENIFEVITRVAPDKNVKKIDVSYNSLIFEDFDPPLYVLPFHKEVLRSETLLSFSSENEEKLFKPGILTVKGVYFSLLSELSHWGPKVFKVSKIVESLMETFPCSFGEDTRILDFPFLYFYPP